MRASRGIRARFAWTRVLLVVPFAVFFSMAQTALRERVLAEGLAEGVRGRLSEGRLERCEAFPELWPGPGGRIRRRARRRPPRRVDRPGVERFFAYGADLVSANPEAPPFPEELRERLGAGEEASMLVDRPEGRQRLLAFRTADDGPCAVVLVEARAPRSGLLPALVPTLAVTLVVIAIAFFAAGPIVRRLRRLTADVRAARRGEAPLVPDARRDEIGELSRAFAEDRAALAARMEELEQRDAALTAYIANTTHDVMLPLTVLQGHLVALRARLGAQAGDARTVELALEESHYLASLVRNLSAAARLDAGLPETERRPVELGPLIERVAARHAPIAAQRDVELTHAAPSAAGTVRGDLTLLEQAVSNLVHNAVRYNEAGGHVAVLLETEDGAFTLTVVDDGPGVDDDALARMAQRRFRSDEARSRHPSGLGLGLAITNDVAERHGFALRFDRPAEGGLRARLTGPLVEGPG